MTSHQSRWAKAIRLLVTTGWVLAAASAMAQSNCDAKRHGIAGKLAKDVQKCTAKAEKAATDPAACITAAQTKASDKWTQASSKGDCDADGSFSVLTSAITSLSSGVEDAIHGGSLCCANADLGGPNFTIAIGSVPTPTCYQYDPALDVLDGSLCIVLGGTGVTNTRCSSSGTCDISPTPGGCCDNIDPSLGISSMKCVVADQTSCGQQLLGTFHPSALCTTSGCQ